MANTFKRYTVQCDGTLQTAMTVAASTTTVVIGMRLANKDGVNSATADVYVDVSGTNINYAGQDTPVPAGSAIELLGGGKLVLEATDKIKVQASATGDLDLILSVLEQT